MTEFGTFLLPVLPLLGLLAMLLLGRYPGCDAIVRVSEWIARHGKARKGVARAAALPKPPRVHAPRGGLLIALGHAQRPPPLAA